MEITHLSSNVQPVDVKTKLRTGPANGDQLDLEDLYFVLQANPNDSRTAMKLAEQLGLKGRDEEALRVLRSVVKIDSRFETVAALGLAEYRVSMDDGALRHLQEAVMIAPEDDAGLFEVFKAMGNIFVRRGEYDLAEDNYHKAYRISPESDVLLVNLGTLCIQRANWEDALMRFRSALQINSANDKAWVGLAIGHRMKGDGELAWGNLEAALGLNPLNEVALTLALDWGPALEKERRMHELLRQFLLAGGWNERFSLAFAYLCWRHGERDLAQLELERLLAVNPGHEQAMVMISEMRAAL